MTARPPTPIAIHGQCGGTAVDHQLGVQFLALDARVSGMDRSIWPSVRYAEHAAAQMLKSAQVK